MIEAVTLTISRAAAQALLDGLPYSEHAARSEARQELLRVLQEPQQPAETPLNARPGIQSIPIKAMGYQSDPFEIPEAALIPWFHVQPVQYLCPVHGAVQERAVLSLWGHESGESHWCSECIGRALRSLGLHPAERKEGA